MNHLAQVMRQKPVNDADDQNKIKSDRNHPSWDITEMKINSH